MGFAELPFLSQGGMIERVRKWKKIKKREKSENSDADLTFFS